MPALYCTVCGQPTGTVPDALVAHPLVASFLTEPASKWLCADCLAAESDPLEVRSGTERQEKT